MIYIYRKNVQLENQRAELRLHLRQHPIDSLDIYEVLMDDIRISAWKEFVDELFAIIINLK